MQALWDNERLLDRQRHRPPRRRWSAALRAECTSKWSTDMISVRATTTKKTTKKQASVAKQMSLFKLTRKDIEDAQKLLQLQTDGFVRSLEIQSLRNNVSDLLESRSRAEGGFREFQSELKALERDVLANDKPAVLDYTLSEQDWLDIIER